MMKRLWLQGVRYSFGLAAAAAILAPAAAHAQIRQVLVRSSQAVGFTLGGFFPKGEDSRVEDDVLFADLDDLAFDIERLQGRVGERRMALLARRLPGSRRRRRLLPEHRAQRLSRLRQRQRLRDRTGSQAADRPGDCNGAVPADRPRQRRAVCRSGIGAFNWRYSEVGRVRRRADSSIFRANYDGQRHRGGPGHSRRRSAPDRRRVGYRRRSSVPAGALATPTPRRSACSATRSISAGCTRW